MSQIEAIFHDGIFEPLEMVRLQENQRVRLLVEPIDRVTLAVWLEQVAAAQRSIVARNPSFSGDSTADIAEDRKR